MDSFMATFFSMSIAGSLLICLLLLCKPFYKNRISKRWQYYIWLVILARLLLPVTLPGSLMGQWFGQIAQMLPETYPASRIAGGTTNGLLLQVEREGMPPSGEPDTVQAPMLESGTGIDGENIFPDGRGTGNKGIEERTPAMAALQSLWMFWLGGVFLFLIRKITIYQGFVKYVKAGCREVSDVALLDQMAQIGEQIGVRRPVELYTNSLVSSPMIFGFFHPYLVLPDTDLPEEDFRYTVRHELIHAKRYDMVYKWLVQITICLHWFNPLVYRMRKEINRLCELSLDEMIICSLDWEQIRVYGDTLLHAMGAGIKGKKSSSKLSRSKTLASMMLGEDAELLKERLGAMMDYKKYSKGMKVVSLVITFAFMGGAMAIGAYASPAEQSVETASEREISNPADQKGIFTTSYAEKYYQEKKLAQFSRVYNILSEEEQKAFVERAYEDERISFFSVAISRMGEEVLEDWLLRADRDGRTSFQLVILDAMGKREEMETIEQELEVQQLEEYQKHGITKEGLAYYYNGQCVDILMDIRQNGSFCVLDMNPQGMVNIRITRGEDGEIETVSYMSQEEVEELLFEDYDGTEDIAITEDIIRMKKEEAPAGVQSAIETCEDGKWYVIEDGKTCYIYFNGLPHNYAYQPEFEEGQVSIGIFDVGVLEKTYVLLAVPEDKKLTVTYNGQEVSLMKLE